MQFEFATATRIVFGRGALAEIGSIAAAFGSRALVVTGKNPDRAKPLIDILSRDGIQTDCFSVPGEPTINDALEGSRWAKERQCEFVIGFGGGSAIDAGKAIAALLTNEGNPLDYLEVIGKGQKLRRPPAPCIAIPTTSGAGAEVTRNAVLASKEHRVKVSLRSPLMLPKAAVIDPELTKDLPPRVTASTGLDALTQLIEPFVSCKANPLTTAICREGIPRAARSLKRAWQNGADMEAREDMSLAALFGGLALANSGLGAVHGFAGPIGGMFPAPHGAVCAALLPGVVATNLKAIRTREPENPVLNKYDEVARLLAGNEEAAAEAAVAWLRGMVKDLEIPPLNAYGISNSHLDEISDKATRASSMKGNPIALEPRELREILTLAL